MTQLTTTKNLILETYAFAKTTYNDWTNFTCFLKHNEEYGELSEALLIEIGQIKHKELKEPVFGEIIDNIIMSIHYYSRLDLHSISINDSINPRTFHDFVNIIFDHKKKNDLIQHYFQQYTLAKAVIIPLERTGFDHDKTLESLNNVFLHLINLSMVLYTLKYPDTTKQDLFNKTIEELNGHFSKKIKKWKTIEDKR